MAEVVYDDSCLFVEEQLTLLAADYRPTVVCALYSPDTNAVALVKSAKERSSFELGCKFIQGGMLTDDAGLPQEAIAGTFEREVEEEVGLDLDTLVVVQGLVTARHIIGGQPRDGKQQKAYGILCGEVRGLPPITVQDPNEVSAARWVRLDVAEDDFGTQLSHPNAEERGQRNLLVVDFIRHLFPRTALREPVF